VRISLTGTEHRHDLATGLTLLRDLLASHG
jgi:hypothetical protein